MSRVNGVFVPQMSRGNWPNAQVPSKLRKTLADNATAAADAKADAVHVISKSEALRKRLTRIKDEGGPSTGMEQLEWFADVVGVAPWELLVPGFDPARRPRLLAHDTEIAGLTSDELMLIKYLRATGKLRWAVGLLDLREDGESAARKEESGELRESSGVARTRAAG